MCVRECVCVCEQLHSELLVVHANHVETAAPLKAELKKKDAWEEMSSVIGRAWRHGDWHVPVVQV